MDTTGNIKKLSDYLHLYLGCEAKSSKGTMVYKLSSVDSIGRCMFFDGFGNDMWLGEDFKLALRPLSDMTEEEIKQVAWLQYNFKAENVRGKDEWGNIKVVNKSPFYYWINPIRSTNPETMIYLLSKHFDLFSLIESGLAIDATTLNKEIK